MTSQEDPREPSAPGPKRPRQYSIRDDASAQGPTTWDGVTLQKKRLSEQLRFGRMSQQYVTDPKTRSTE